MKAFTIIAALALLSTAFSFNFRGEINNALGLIGGLGDLKEFWSALGAELKIDTSSVPACYGTFSAPLYWKWVQEETNAQKYLVEANEIKFFEHGAEVAAATLAIHSEYNCMMSSEGYAELNKTMGYDTIPDGKLGDYMKVYIFGLAAQNYDQYLSVYSNLEKGDWTTAGTNQAIVYTHQGYNTTHFYNRSFGAGVSNGVFFKLGVQLPLDLYECYNETEAQARNELWRGWASTVASATEKTCVEETEKWFNSTGNALIEQLQSSIACENQTASIQALNKALG